MTIQAGGADREPSVEEIYRTIREHGSDLEIFSFLPEEGVERFDGCFDFTTESVAPGEKVSADGRLGILLDGRGVISNDGRIRTGQRGMLFGVKRGADGREHPAEGWYQAATSSIVVWSGFDIIVRVCYGSCWFHGRFRQELLDQYERQEKEV